MKTVQTGTLWRALPRRLRSALVSRCGDCCDNVRRGIFYDHCHH